MFNRISQLVDKTKTKVKAHIQDGAPPPPSAPFSPTTPSNPSPAGFSNKEGSSVIDRTTYTISQPPSSSARPIPPPQHSSRKSAQMSPPGLTTVPCQYRTGKTLGSGTYAIVKEAVHIGTNDYYACKVINKKLMEGREYMVRNEIAVLKKISKGHKNIVTLHDYFETQHNLYLCFDLCTGGELFDRICKKGNYYEADAAGLVRTIFKAVQYIHSCGIVHRDLKPENLLFRTPDESADIMIADFGLSRIMDEEKLSVLTEVCGTPGYMAPEIFKKTGHGKPVDVWAMGVITYFLLCGYTPFDRDNAQQEMQAICSADYKFDSEYWSGVSDTAKDFVRTCFTVDIKKRPTAAEALEHPWLASDEDHFVPDPDSPSGGPTDLLPTIQKAFNAKKTLRKAILSIVATRRLTSFAHGLTTDAVNQLSRDVLAFKKESELEQVNEAGDVHAWQETSKSPSTPKVPIDSTATSQQAAVADHTSKSQ